MRCARPIRAIALALVFSVAACGTPPKKHTPVKKKPAATQSVKPKTTTTAPRKTAAPPPAPKASPAVRGEPEPAPSPRPAPAQQANAPPAEPRTPQARYAQALDLLKASRWQEAEAALLVSVKDYPRSSGPHTNLGILYARTNRKMEALAEFRRAIAANPQNAVALNWIGVLAREAGDLKNAEHWYRRAVNSDSGYAPAWLNLAILYDQHVKRPQDALEAYQRYRALAGSSDPRAAVWIAELEARLKGDGTSAAKGVTP